MNQPPNPAPPQWTGPFRRRLGDLDLTVVTDRTYHLDGGAMFGVVPKPLWSKHVVADDANRVRAGLNCLFTRIDGKLVLIETGAGDKLDARQVRFAGLDPVRDLPTRLAAAGCDPAAVDLVVNSHLHYDHCGWNTRRDPDGRVVATFPRAAYYVQRVEWEHACEQHERDRVSYLPDNYEPLRASGALHLLDGDRELLPGLRLEVMPGHTRGMQAVLLHSHGQTACYISDLMPTHWHVKPTWLMAFDLFPLETIAGKHRVLERAVRENWLFVFTHDPEVPWGRVERQGDDYRFVSE